jgi:hypothetical protein
MDTSKSTFSKQGKAGVADHITFDQSAIGICDPGAFRDL